ncbi:MFS transporter [uncultured Chitinophaga sp.]|jgi:Arabinose efflux permease|uniref:MFS transporter n=1 Tax=uncultured Chitinophaga sp. TaxID=339340 RepID=UPI00262E8A07|nr:MFS transporter [uncultured Chitinophaga sp.]
MTDMNESFTGRKERFRPIATLLSLALLPLSGFATDIYVPSLPDMAADLHISNLQIQFTITIFLVSYGVSQLFIGSILDSFGRYRIGIASLLIFSLASFAIATTHSITVMYLMRVIQGITVGAVMAGKRVYFVDVFTGDKLKHYLSLFSIIWSTGPIVAPFVGGWLQTLFGWQASFYALAGVALVFALLEFIFNEETLRQRASFQLRHVVSVYGNMLSTRSFVLGISLLGLAYSMVMVYNMTGAFIVEHHLGYSVVSAGYCALVLGFAWMVGGFISKAMIHRSFFTKLALNTGLQLVIALLMLSSGRATDNLYILVIFAFLIHVGAGFTFNNYMTYCMMQFPKNAGVASGLIGGFTFAIVSGLSYLMVKVLPAKDGVNLGLSYLILILVSILTVYFAFREETVRRRAMALS